MKKLNLSRTGRIILIAGVFVVVIGALAFVSYQQSAQQAMAEEELTVAELRLAKIDNSALEAAVKDLQGQLSEREQQVEEALRRLDESVISADVAEEFYQVAQGRSVTVDIFGTTEISEEIFEGTSVLKTSVDATVSASSLRSLVDFVICLNNAFTTGYVNEARFSRGSADDPASSVDLTMTVYTKGEDL
jgi:hypothetical protein